MSENVRELKVNIKGFLGSERAYWHGNSLRVAFPVELVEKLDLTRRKGKFFLDAGEKRRFLFFETDKGVLVKVVDEAVEKRLKDILGFMDICRLSKKDFDLIFG